MDDVAVEALLAPIDETAHRVYAWLLENGRSDHPRMAAELGIEPDELRSAVEALKHWRLLRETADGTMVLADRPDAALAETILMLEATITGFQLAVIRMRDRLDALLTRRRTPNDQGTMVSLATERDLATALRILLDGSPREVLIASPRKSPWPDAMWQTLSEGRPPLPSTAKVQLLYQHSSRFDPTARRHAESARAAGAEVRTVGELPNRIIIFDREAAVLTGSDGQDALLVRESTVVDLLVRIFHQFWQEGTDFAGENGWRSDAHELVGTVRQDIIRLLMDGARDEAIAQRLNMSVRTCRRHIAAIMEQLGAESRFQAGHLLREQGYTG
ncbi:helix-turn-helix transcriptional regulator [Micromonospora schwarzwaldensis]|uniref:helix-turn-helix transcriptional regulator n=1 Tax=Micromonospora sp. DSM 45708 TaxID=3111767 RepID=UPI0031D61D19